MTNVVQPDILFIFRENFAILTDENVKGAPDLVVEIISPTTKSIDRGFKKIIYEKFGVKEYWIIDPDEQIIEVYVLKKQKMNLFHQVKKTGQIKSQMFAALKIDSQSVFAGRI